MSAMDYPDPVAVELRATQAERGRGQEARMPLVRQIAAGEIAIEKMLQDRSCYDPAALRALVKTLAWMRANEDALKALATLVCNPAVQAVRQAFPDAKIVALRDLETGAGPDDGDIEA